MSKYKITIRILNMSSVYTSITVSIKGTVINVLSIAL